MDAFFCLQTAVASHNKLRFIQINLCGCELERNRGSSNAKEYEWRII